MLEYSRKLEVTHELLLNSNHFQWTTKWRPSPGELISEPFYPFKAKLTVSLGKVCPYVYIYREREREGDGSIARVLARARRSYDYHKRSHQGWAKGCDRKFQLRDLASARAHTANPKFSQAGFQIS